jgi:ribosome maturation factor RimP
MPTTYEREKQLERDIAPRVEQDLPGVDVLAVELVSPTRFCVYVDHPEGVDHALCSRVTDLLRDYLREYTVDVSSPGLERPLRRPEHFARFAGRRVSLRTAEPVAGRSKFKGTIAAAGGDALTLDVVDGGRIDIPYASVVRGNLIDEG